MCFLLDHPLTPASGMKLRHRVIIREKYDELVTSDESSEDDSDESDNWVMPKSRKSRSIKRKKMNLVPPNSLKKQHTSEEVHIGLFIFKSFYAGLLKLMSGSKFIRHVMSQSKDLHKLWLSQRDLLISAGSTLY